MSSFIVYSCPCNNIKIHLSTKYTNEELPKLKEEATVQTPSTGWEYELGMGGIVTEFKPLAQSKSPEIGWETFSCLNCNSGNVYSLANKDGSNKVVIHENALVELEKLKQSSQYSTIFNIKLINDEHADNLIPMPGVEDVPDKLISTHKEIQNLIESSAEKYRIESKARIEEFRQQEEERLNRQLSNAKSESNQLWSKIIHAKNDPPEEKKERAHVRFAPEVEETQSLQSSHKKSSFDLDESAISSSLKDLRLDHLLQPNLIGNKQIDSLTEDEEEEDMFNLDEEFSDEEPEKSEVVEEDEEELNESDEKETKDQEVSSSIKDAIPEMNEKLSWIRKKRNTNKYLTEDFDIKFNHRKDSHSNEEPSDISMFATSVPITIHYPSAEKESKEEEKDATPKKKDILASSFANIDFSYSDRLLSEQFPPPRRRKSAASSSLINPQLDSLVGKSLDTRGLMSKKKNALEPREDREDFDTSLPPHVWAAMEEYADE